MIYCYSILWFGIQFHIIYTINDFDSIQYNLYFCVLSFSSAAYV